MSVVSLTAHNLQGHSLVSSLAFSCSNVLSERRRAVCLEVRPLEIRSVGPPAHRSLSENLLHSLHTERLSVRPETSCSQDSPRRWDICIMKVLQKLITNRRGSRSTNLIPPPHGEIYSAISQHKRLSGAPGSNSRKNSQRQQIAWIDEILQNQPPMSGVCSVRKIPYLLSGLCINIAGGPC